MLAIKMTGAYIDENHDTRKYFFVTGNEENELDRQAAGMFVFAWLPDPRFVHYETDEAEYWELKGYYDND